MRHYELVLLLKSDRSGQGDGVAERYKKMIGDSGGQLHRFESWGRRHLAYPIDKQSHAHYYLFNFECEQEFLGALKENLRFSESVMRYLIVRRSGAITKASPIAKETEAASQSNYDGGDDRTSGRHYSDRSNRQRPSTAHTDSQDNQTGTVDSE